MDGEREEGWERGWERGGKGGREEGKGSVKYSIIITTQGPWTDKSRAEVLNREFRTISVHGICISQKLSQFSRLRRTPLNVRAISAQII